MKRNKAETKALEVNLELQKAKNKMERTLHKLYPVGSTVFAKPRYGSKNFIEYEVIGYRFNCPHELWVQNVVSMKNSDLNVPFLIKENRFYSVMTGSE